MHTPGNLYADLAGYYDQFCHEVDYTEQCAFLKRAFDCLALSDGRQYLDLACGTGQHLAHMIKQGFVATGLDNSADMLQQAKARCPQADMLLCDLAEFDHHASFDLISCFLYSIHYSYPVSRLNETLRRAWSALKPGGVFVFNTVDARGIDSNRMITTRTQEGGNQLEFCSGWQYAGEGDAMTLKLTISCHTPDGVQQWQDAHTMTAISLPELQHMLADIGFDVLLFEYDYKALIPWAGKSFNVIVAARKLL
ncbi:class I SAM-dependent DNA methyltransferase [Aurantivibrio plasticivorans]